MSKEEGQVFPTGVSEFKCQGETHQTARIALGVWSVVMTSGALCRLASVFCNVIVWLWQEWSLLDLTITFSNTKLTYVLNLVSGNLTTNWAFYITAIIPWSVTCNALRMLEISTSDFEISSWFKLVLYRKIKLYKIMLIVSNTDEQKSKPW